MIVTLGSPGIWNCNPSALADRLQWIGTIKADDGRIGSLARVRSTGLLVQVNAGAMRMLDQARAEAALIDARTINARE